MKKDEIEVGGVYEAKVSDCIVAVRIDSVHSSRGWNATNTKTGKRIHVKSAQRLRRPVPVAEAPNSPKTARSTPKSTNPAAATKKKDPKATKEKQSNSKNSPKRLSAIDAAAAVLAESKAPMNALDLVKTMAAKKLWTSPGGKTPHATLYAAIHREIFKKGKAARFKKVDRGLFTFNDKATN